MLGYSTLAFASALALFLYPHSVTGVLATRSRDTIKRNMAALPIYSIVLGLLALLGNILVGTLGTLALLAAKRPVGHDSTEPGDYVAEMGDPDVTPLPAAPEEAAPTR